MTTEPLTDQQLGEIEQRADAATEGPWTVDLQQCDCSDGLCSHGAYVSSIYADGERRTGFSDFPDADWQFVIRARQDVPALVAEVRRLRAQAAELEGDADLLSALQAAGVDNWEGYDDALERLAP